jgi:hypothetical protein
MQRALIGRVNARDGSARSARAARPETSVNGRAARLYLSKFIYILQFTKPRDPWLTVLCVLDGVASIMALATLSVLLAHIFRPLAASLEFMWGEVVLLASTR